MVTDERQYHHGNLRRALLDAALEEIAEGGPGAVSLRALARRTGVSHAAPAHHFGDRTGLLTAIATEGSDLLADALEAAAPDGFAAVGQAYIGFAIGHPAHFAVMFRPDLVHDDDPDLAAARARGGAVLYGPAGAGSMAGDTDLVGLAGWTFAHGFATLWQAGNLQARLGDDPMAAAARVSAVLFDRRR